LPVIDHFRHSIRNPPDEHLTLEGVRLARRVGETLPEYDLVATSPIPRAIETAIAMGYGVDQIHWTLGTMMFADKEMDWEQGFAVFAEAARRGGLTTHAAQCHADFLRTIAAELAPDGRALVVSHGGIVELGVVGLLPGLDYISWGGVCERCEGVRLYFEGDRCTHAELLRLASLIPAP
jgi:broad specificity phosphatase PhoE